MTHATHRGLGRMVPRTRRSRITALVVTLLILAAAAGGGYWYADTHIGRTNFSAMFRESVGIYPGSDVRVLGVPVGRVDSVSPEGATVKVSMYLDPGIAVRADTRAVVIAPSLVSDRYIQLTGVYGGPSSGAKLAGGAVIPLSRTATSVEIDQLSTSIVDLTRALGPNGANKNGAFADLLNVSAANLKGNGAALKRTIDRLGAASGTLANSRGDLFRTVSNLATFTRMLQNNDRSVRGFNTSLASVAHTLADDRQSFAAALQQLSIALGKVKTFIDDNRSLLSSNVKKLAVITQTLVSERASLAQALQTAPLAVDNLIKAYDPQHNVLVGRADLNELSLWADQQSTSSGSTSGGSSAPPMLLPSSGSTVTSGQ